MDVSVASGAAEDNGCFSGTEAWARVTVLTGISSSQTNQPELYCEGELKRTSRRPHLSCTGRCVACGDPSRKDKDFLA